MTKIPGCAVVDCEGGEPARSGAADYHCYHHFDYHHFVHGVGKVRRGVGGEYCRCVRSCPVSTPVVLVPGDGHFLMMIMDLFGLKLMVWTMITIKKGQPSTQGR